MTIKNLAVFIFLLSACSDGPQDYLRTAEAALGKGAHARAVEAADRGLAAEPADAALGWRLELVRLEALARSGRAEATLETIERLAGTQGSPIQASHYLSTADQLRASGERAGAIQLLDKGKQKFPDNSAIAKAISRAKEQGSDKELEALRSLGYLD